MQDYLFIFLGTQPRIFLYRIIWPGNLSINIPKDHLGITLDPLPKAFYDATAHIGGKFSDNLLDGLNIADTAYTPIQSMNQSVCLRLMVE